MQDYMAGDIKLEQYYAGDGVWFDFVAKLKLLI